MIESYGPDVSTSCGVFGRLLQLGNTYVAGVGGPCSPIGEWTALSEYSQEEVELMRELSTETTTTTSNATPISSDATPISSDATPISSDATPISSDATPISSATDDGPTISSGTIVLTSINTLVIMLAASQLA